jgi:NitT/TauT family transport system substrate-binding protein
MKKWKAIIAALILAVLSGTARAEVSELRIPLGAGGFGFLPLFMMQKYSSLRSMQRNPASPLRSTGPSSVVRQS